MVMSGCLCRGRQRRGIALPWIAISLVMLLSFVALAVDGGYIYVSRAQMQRAADASALAGASALLQGDDAATGRAIECAGLNAVASSPVIPQEVAVTIGNWEWYARQFYPTTGEETVSPNAVHVNGTRTGMRLFFAPVMGIDTTDVIKSATALVGSGKCAGVWGLEGITVRGDVITDSYHSDEGGYGDGEIYANGDLCSCRDLDLMGGVSIRGDAMYGEGYTYTAHGGSHEVWGVVDDFPCGMPTFDFDMEDATLNNDNDTIGLTDYGRSPFPRRPWDLILIEDDNVTLTGGTYFFTSVRLRGQSTITVTGPTIIYVSGGASFTGGGVLNVTEDPANLTIYGTGRTMVFSGTSVQYASVIAPQTDIVMHGTVDYYGTMLGKSLEITGTFNLHVDEKVVLDLFGIEMTAPVLVE